MNVAKRPVLWLNGPEGVGKSTVAFVIFRQLSDKGIKCAFVNDDQVGLCYPAPKDDPENYRVKAAGLAAVWTTYRQEGARCMVVSGIVETRAIAKARLDLLPDARVTMIRLRVGSEELRRRLIGRGGGEDHAEIVRVAEQMDRDDPGDRCVDTDGLTPFQTAERVRVAASGWPGLS